MEQPALTILNAHRIMSVSTLRPDGWPQTTIVGYANAGFDIYFLIFRSSQKFANIGNDARVSIAVGEEPREMGELQAFYAGAIASEVTDAAERDSAWKLLLERHPNLGGFEHPAASETAMMRARCRYISVLDFTKGMGHAETLTLDEGGRPVDSAERGDDWSSSTARQEDGDARNDPESR